jgi:drug/metabolite transporter (DMT)-like permease
MLLNQGLGPFLHVLLKSTVSIVPLFGEQLHGFHLLGAALIGGGILLATWPKAS